MHGTGCAAHLELQGHGLATQPILLELQQVAAHDSGLVVADNNNLLGVVLHKHPDKAVYEVLAMHFDHWLGCVDALSGQTRSFTSGNNSKFHCITILL